MGQIVKTAGGKIIEKAQQDIIYNSEGSIANNAAKKIQQQGIEKGISYGDYEQLWEGYTHECSYLGYFGFTSNSDLLHADLGTGNKLKTNLTGISMVLRYESYNPIDLVDNEITHPLRNWLWIYTMMMDRRGEILSGDVTRFSYRADRQVTSSPGDRSLTGISSMNYPLTHQGKELHDSVFLDKKLLFAAGYEREMDYGKADTSEDFYAQLAKYLVEASKFNRCSDISYIYAAMSKKDDYVKEMGATLGLADFPLLGSIFTENINVFRSFSGIIGYLTGLKDLLSLIESFREFRGPVLLEPVRIKRKYEGTIIQNDTQNFADALTTDLELLGAELDKNRKR